FDYKPELKKYDNKPYPGEKPRGQFAQTGNLLASPFEFKPGGKCGTMISDLFPHVRDLADDLCVIRSIHADNSAHGGALLQLHTGSDKFVPPSIGAWVPYGLGTEDQNLPGFITICPTLGHGGVQNWSSAFLPAAFQGTPIGHAGIKAREARLNNITSPDTPADLQRMQLDLWKQVNQQHLDRSGPDLALEGRINSFELAYRMQAEAPGLMDLAGESKETLALYRIGKERTDNLRQALLLLRA